MQSFGWYLEQGTYFTMHHLVHDLAISLLSNQMLDQNKQGNTSGGSFQHVLLSDQNKSIELIYDSHQRLKELRCGAAFALASSLRVLDLSKRIIQTLPNSFSQLQQLRYLSAPSIQGEMVPDCITELSNLIYLNLRRSNIGALPFSIGNLKDLMHLDLSECSKIRDASLIQEPRKIGAFEFVRLS
jgi:Leucine-rich repeat (LRR) protein